MFDAAQRATMRQRLESLAARQAAVRERVAADRDLAARLHCIEAYQASRLARTHADLHSKARYRLAVDFFLQDLYGPQDLSQRDAQMVRALDKLGRYLPLKALSSLAHALDLHVLTLELDAATAACLPGPVLPDDAVYAQAYRAAGRRADRERQIDLLAVIGGLLDAIADRPEVGLLVRVSRAPAQAAGLGHLHDFVERGYRAFRAMHGAAEFLQVVVDRERALLHRLYARGADPR